MAGYNRIVMIGNLTRDPDYKQLTSGQAVCKLGLASNRQFKNRQTGNMIQEVCYVDVDVWGAQAESCRQYLQKGRAVLIEGRLKLDSWQDPNGQSRNKHSIVADRVVFLNSGNNDSVEAPRQEAAPVGNKPLDPSNELEKELLDQIDAIKTKTAKKAAAPKPAAKSVEPSVAKQAENNVVKAATKPVEPKAEEPTVTAQNTDAPSVDFDFKDEPPFQDDLPF